MSELSRSTSSWLLSHECPEMIYYTRNTRLSKQGHSLWRCIPNAFLRCVISVGVRVIMLMVDWLWIWRCFLFPLDKAISFVIHDLPCFLLGQRMIYLFENVMGEILLLLLLLGGRENETPQLWMARRTKGKETKSSIWHRGQRKRLFCSFFLSFCANVEQILEDHPKYVRNSNYSPFPIL